MKQLHEHSGNTNLIVRKVKRDAHWNWMNAGWQNFKASQQQSIKIGVLVVVISAAIVGGLFFTGLGAFIPAAYGAFALVGPLIATLIYQISRKLEEGKESQRDLQQVSFIGFALSFIILVWALLAFLLYSLAVGITAPMSYDQFVRFVLETPQGLIMMVIGTIIGGALALIGYSIAAVSIPLAFDKDVDALSAMAASAQAVILNPMTMLSWAFVISVCVALSAPLAFLPMVVIFPWLGHTTWSAYRELIEVK